MKPDQVNKLYKQLSPIEQANLYIEAVTKKLGDAEVGLIIESVQRVTYDLSITHIFLAININWLSGKNRSSVYKRYKQ